MHGPWRHGREEWRTPRERPPWWPENEAWPPESGRPWRAMSARFARRMALFAAIAFVVFAFVVAAFVALLLGTFGGVGAGAAVPLAAFLLLVVSFNVARGVRRLIVPLGDLIDGAERVESGDYSVRVRERGPRELKALSRAFNAMSSRLERSEAERRRLLADVSHELRTPLAIVQGNLEAIIDGVHAADEAHVRPILDETRVLARLIEDLRTLSLAEAGVLALHREPTDVAALARDTAASFAASATTAGPSIETTAAAPIEADVDPVRVREVLANLIANAVRYARTRVQVALSSTDDRVTVAVVDDGAGIPADALPHVFERFSKSPESRGAGLGLAIAKSLVAAHGGEISARSENGRGTTITFTLPRGG